MVARGQALERIISEVAQLAPEDRLRLIQRVAESLVPEAAPEARPASAQRLVYGQFGGGRMSTDEDFANAEWRPTEQDLSGS